MKLKQPEVHEHEEGDFNEYDFIQDTGAIQKEKLESAN